MVFDPTDRQTRQAANRDRSEGRTVIRPDDLRQTVVLEQIPRHELEQKFLTLLESLRPRPEFLALFRRIVLDVWKAQRENHAAKRAAAEKKVADLKRRKEQLVEAFIYQRVIDQDTYKQQLDKLNESMALAEIDQHDERTEELDIEAVLDFAERVSLNAARLWLEANLAQRQVA